MGNKRVVCLGDSITDMGRVKEFDGTVIVVSHDREFLDGMVDKIYEFRDGGVHEYLGGIYYFLEKRKIESLSEIERHDRPQPTEPIPRNIRRRSG